jgi:hypothetical protein
MADRICNCNLCGGRKIPLAEWLRHASNPGRTSKRQRSESPLGMTEADSREVKRPRAINVPTSPPQIPAHEATQQRHVYYPHSVVNQASLTSQSRLLNKPDAPHTGALHGVHSGSLGVAESSSMRSQVSGGYNARDTARNYQIQLLQSLLLDARRLVADISTAPRHNAHPVDWSRQLEDLESRLEGVKSKELKSGATYLEICALLLRVASTEESAPEQTRAPYDTCEFIV